MWEWLSRWLIYMAMMLALFSFIMAALRTPTDFGKATCIMAAAATLVQMIRFEIKN